MKCSDIENLGHKMLHKSSESYKNELKGSENYVGNIIKCSYCLPRDSKI